MKGFAKRSTWPSNTVLFSVASSMVGITSLFWAILPAQAQFTDAVPFQNVSIQSKFEPDPLLLRGVSGGEAAAAAIAGRSETETGLCFGYVNESPDHVVTLENYFNYLDIQVRSNGDTMLVIQGPGGIWCNDDTSVTRNPRIAGQWLPGQYRIWVGSAEANRYFPYQLRLSEIQ